MSTPRTSPTMSMSDEVERLADELTRLRAENLALRERADLRAIVGELRRAETLLSSKAGAGYGLTHLRDLLRRLEEP